MSIKNTLITLGILILVLVVVGVLSGNNKGVMSDNDIEEQVVGDENIAQYTSVTFTGELQVIDQRCAIDAPCGMIVDGKFIQTSPGFVPQEYAESLGMSNGTGNVDDIVALTETTAVVESEPMVLRPVEPIMVEAHVRLHEDGMYSIYGSNDYYVRIIEQ